MGRPNACDHMRVKIPRIDPGYIMSAAIPETIGNYRIIGKLGQGGMGMVLRAVQETLDRPVALKLLPAEFANDHEYLMRFLREAKTVATLRHENVVQVYDAGEQNGQYYIAMELIEGSTLLKYAEEKKQIGESEGLNLMLQAARGLAAAHAKGLVHRDIKPENMLLGNDQILRILDFGLVMESTSTTQLTATGACLGTPMYMSPEQADGIQADARSDVYSLGVTFYRVLVGQTPFTSPTVMNLLFKHKFESPPNPKTLRPDLSQDTVNLLLHMLAKRREDRPQTAQAVVDMIEGLKHGKPIPPPPVYIIPNFIGPSDTHPSGDLATPAGTAASVDSSPAVPRPSTVRRLAARHRQDYVMTGAVVVAALALGIWFILAMNGVGSHLSPLPPPTPTMASPLPKVPVATPSDGGSIARGDEAFGAQRFSEAAEEYEKALAKQPDNSEVKAKLDKTRNAIKFEDLMQTAYTLEAKGDLEAAAESYAQAAALDTGNKATTRLESIKASIAQNEALSTKEKDAGREQFSKQAEDLKRAGKFDLAAQVYSRAAALSEGATRLVFADEANECRRQDCIHKAMAAEELQNFGEAQEQYKKALALKPDALLEDKLREMQKAAKEAAGKSAEQQRIAKEAAGKSAVERTFDAAMRDAQKALEAGDLIKARAGYVVAMGLKPGDAAATERMQEIDGLELLARGNAQREAGNSAAALSAYTQAAQKYPALAAEARRLITALPQALSPDAIKKIDGLVRAQKDLDAMAALDAELELNPANADLRSCKAALSSLQSCASTYSELDKLIERSAEKINDAIDLDEKDDKLKDAKARFKTLRAQFSDNAGKPRPAFLDHKYPSLLTALQSSRDDAGELDGQLIAAADMLDKKAEKVEKGGKGPFFLPFGGGGDKKKAEKFRILADSFRKIAEQSESLHK